MVKQQQRELEKCDATWVEERKNQQNSEKGNEKII